MTNVLPFDSSVNYKTTSFKLGEKMWFFLLPSGRLDIHHKDGMRQPDMAFTLCQESDHLAEAGGGCSGTPYRNIRILIPCVGKNVCLSSEGRF
jgi:hypothetical protein